MAGPARPFTQLMKRRRSIRRYHPEPVADDTLLALLDAARWAPSAHNRQPWRFIVIQPGEQRARLAEAMGARLRADLRADGLPAAQIDADCRRSRQRIIDAPALVLLCLTMEDMDQYPDEVRSRAEFLMAVQSVAMAGQNLMLAAQDAGLASCWLCAPLFCPETVGACLKLPPRWQAQGLISLGRAAVKRNKERRSLTEVVAWR